MVGSVGNSKVNTVIAMNGSKREDEAKTDAKYISPRNQFYCTCWREASFALISFSGMAFNGIIT